ELLKAVWPEAIVEEVNLANNVSILRKALGESEESRFIETVPRRGYRFVGNPTKLLNDNLVVEASLESKPDAVVAPSEVPTTIPVFFPRSSTKGNRRSTGVLIGAVLFIASVGIYYTLGRKVPSPSPAQRLVQLTSDTGLTTDPAISLDASLLAYASDRGG